MYKSSEARQRHFAVLELLDQFLGEAGWQHRAIREDEDHGVVLHARFHPDAKRTLRFLVAAGQPHAEDLAAAGTFLVHDDADKACPKNTVRGSGSWASLSELVAVSGGLAQVSKELRLGRDLLFPFLSSGASRRLPAYADDVSVKYDLNVGCSDRFSADSARIVSCEGLLRTEYHGADYKTKPASLDELRTDCLEGRRMLLAVHHVDSAPELFSRLLFRPHVERLCDAGADVPTRLPLFLPAEEISTLGYTRTLREELWRATRTSFTAEMIRRMTRAGYLHVYVPNLDRLRFDTDLDPNTLFISDILASGGQWGGFTLGCQRFYVFQEPIFERQSREKGRKPKLDAPWLRTVGDRFAYAKGFTLYDLGRPDQKDLESRHAVVERTVEAWSESIAALSGARIDPREARRLLLQIAIREVERNGSLIPRSDLPHLIRQVVGGERRRPEHIAYIESALLGSGAVRHLDSGHVSVSSDLLLGGIVAHFIGSRLHEARWTNKWDLFKPVLSISQLPYWIMRWGVSACRFDDIEELRSAAQRLLTYYGISRESDPTEANQRENLINFLLASMDIFQRWSANEGNRTSPEELFATEMKVNATAIALPQRAFSGLDLSDWRFTNCNLRGALFVECRLDYTEFDDCFLGGARFINCTFSGQTSFRGSDLSGALFLGAQGLEKTAARDSGGLEGVNLSSAFIQSQGLGKEFIRDIAASGCITLGLEVRSSSKAAQAQGPNESERQEELPDAYYESLGKHAWIDDDGACVIDTAKGTRLISARQATGGKYASGWNEDARPIEIKSVTTASGTVLLALDDHGGLLAANLAAPSARWTTLSTHPGATTLAVDAHGNDIRVAVAASGKDGRTVTVSTSVLKLSESGTLHVAKDLGTIDEGLLKEMRGGVEVSALRWLGQETPAATLDLAVGLSNGGFMVFQHAGSWKRQCSTLDVRSAVKAIGFSRLNNLLFVSHDDGQTVGYRRSHAEQPHILFKFQSAHRQIYDIVELGKRGQILILGSPYTVEARKGSKELRDVPMLCLLANTAGYVLAVYPQPADRVAKAKGDYELPGRRSANAADEAASEVEDTARKLDFVSQKIPSMTFRPGMDSALNFVLTNTLGSEMPTQSIMDGSQRRFRSIRLDMTSDDGFSRTFEECDLTVREDGAALSVVADIAVPEGAEAIKADLRITYLSAVGQQSPELSRSWAFDVDIERHYNPYTADGSPVIGDQFFGHAGLIEDCIGHLMEKRIVIVCSRRRAGKTSFFLETARRIARRDKPGEVSRLSVVVSGEQTQEGKGIVSAIADKLEEIESTAVEYKGLSAILRNAVRDGYRSDSEIICLQRVAEEIDRRGIPLPFTVFIDEWGLIAKKRSKAGTLDQHNEGYVASFMDQANHLKSKGVSLCLTSVPSDFTVPANASESNPYRYAIDPWLEIQPLVDEDCRTLIINPLAKPDFEIDTDAVDLVVALSSCVPDDANRIMHYALKSLREEIEKNPKKTKRRISSRHIQKAEPETLLLSKYRDQMPSLLSELSDDQQQLLFDWAGSAREPPRWEKEEIPIMGLKASLGQEQITLEQVFGNLGYRKTHGGSALKHKLWIPHGLTLAIREVRDSRAATVIHALPTRRKR